jgi:hypothetical protein
MKLFLEKLWRFQIEVKEVNEQIISKSPVW